MSELPYDPRMDPQLPGGAAQNWPPPAAVATPTAGPAPAAFEPPLFDTPAPVFPPVPDDPFPAAGPAQPEQPQPEQPQPVRPGSAAGPVGDDMGTVLPRPDLITLVSGRQVHVRKLATRELLSLLAIGLAGVGPNIGSLALNPDSDDSDVFVAKFAGLIISGMLSPASRDETMAFLRAVVDPVGKVSGIRVDKAQRARNEALDAELDAELYNADPDDTISIIEAVAANNAGDLQSWGKRLAGIWRLAQRTGQIPASPTSRG